MSRKHTFIPGAIIGLVMGNFILLTAFRCVTSRIQFSATSFYWFMRQPSACFLG